MNGRKRKIKLISVKLTQKRKPVPATKWRHRMRETVLISSYSLSWGFALEFVGCADAGVEQTTTEWHINGEQTATTVAAAM